MRMTIRLNESAYQRLAEMAHAERRAVQEQAAFIVERHVQQSPAQAAVEVKHGCTAR